MNEGVELRFEPLTVARLVDLEQLLGRHGGHGGCWCMRWRMRRLEFERGKGESNRKALARGVAGGRIKGVLGYSGARAVAWCALGPRDEFPGLAQSELLAPVDDRPVWSISCLYVARDHRRAGLPEELLRAAVRYAASCGAECVEGYPLVPIRSRIAVAFAWTGFESSYRRAGFEVVARRNDIRPIVRIVVDRATQDEPAASPS